jgi:hypothetical protein
MELPASKHRDACLGALALGSGADEPQTSTRIALSFSSAELPVAVSCSALRSNSHFSTSKLEARIAATTAAATIPTRIQPWRLKGLLDIL